MQKESFSAMRGIIGIIPESEIEGQASHNGIGSGVIFAKKYDITILPSLLLFKNKEYLGKVEGYYQVDQQEELIAKIKEIIS